MWCGTAYSKFSFSQDNIHLQNFAVNSQVEKQIVREEKEGEWLGIEKEK